ILDRASRLARAEPVHLQAARPAVLADRGGGGQVHVGQLQAEAASDAELAIALVVAFAEIDRVEVVPDPQQMRMGCMAEVFGQAAVELFGGEADRRLLAAFGLRAVPEAQ